MIPLLHRLTKPDRLKFAGLLCLLGWVAAFFWTNVLPDRLVGSKDVVVGGDFMAFYAAGETVRSGQGASLYSATVQRQVQARILEPETQKGFYYYINPASVAVTYSPLARLPYRAAFYLHTLIMTGFFLTGMWVLRPHLSTVRSSWLAAALVGLTWFPMIHSVITGQNTALSFMCLSIAYAATIKNRQWLAGLALGVLLFKPQYAVPLVGLLLLRRRFGTVAVALACAGAHYLLGAWACGWDWPADMVRSAAGYFHEFGRVLQGRTHIALLEVTDYSVILPLEARGASPALIASIKGVIYALVAAVIGYLIWAWRHADPARPDFVLYWALAIAGSLLISPHSHYYDAGLLLLAVLLILDNYNRRAQPVGWPARLALALVYLGYPFAFGFVLLIRFQPVILISVWIACWSARLVRESQKRIPPMGSYAEP